MFPMKHSCRLTSIISPLVDFKLLLIVIHESVGRTKSSDSTQTSQSLREVSIDGRKGDSRQPLQFPKLEIFILLMYKQVEMLCENTNIHTWKHLC